MLYLVFILNIINKREIDLFNPLLEKIETAIIKGDSALAEQLVNKALQEGLNAQIILNNGLMRGADKVGKLFDSGEVFLPELMYTSRALKSSISILTPYLQQSVSSADNSGGLFGRVVIATIQSDIHDIGKNIVSTMLTTAGFEVIDLGVDVPIKRIISTAIDTHADIIACSAMLTTSMPYMGNLIQVLNSMSERNQFKVMVGGASVTPDFAAKIGADGTAPNAIQAMRLAQQLMSSFKE